MLLAFAVMMLVGIPLRTVLLYGYVDARNGFYVNSPELKATAFYIVTFVGTAIFVFANIFFRQKVLLKSEWKSRSLCAVGSCFALALIFDFIRQFILFFSGNDMMELYGGVLLSVNSKWPLIVQGTLALFAAFYVVLFALSNVLENFSFSSFAPSAVFPALWCAFRLVRTFFAEVNLFNTSQRFIEMLMLIFAMMFFHNFAKYNALYRNGVRYSALTASGWTAAFLSFLVSVPPLLLMVSGNAEMLPFTETSVIADFFMGTFILTVLLKNNFSQRSE